MKRILKYAAIASSAALLALTACKKDDSSESKYTAVFDIVVNMNDNVAEASEAYIIYTDENNTVQTEKITGKGLWEKKLTYNIYGETGTFTQAFRLACLNRNTMKFEGDKEFETRVQYSCEVVYNKNGNIMDFVKKDEQESNEYDESKMTEALIVPIEYEFSVVWRDNNVFNIQRTNNVKLPELKVVTFDDIEFDDSKIIANASFCSGIIDFDNVEDQTYPGTYYGFYASEMHNTNDGTYTNQYSVYNTNASSDAAFGVVYYAEYNNVKGVMSFNDKKARTIVSIAVNNSTYAAKTMINGNSPARAFKDGDWFNVIIEGFNGTESTGKVTASLADFTAGKSFIMSEWTNVDLTSLGEVTSLAITVDSSDKGVYGINTPTYVCVDDIYYIEK